MNLPRWYGRNGAPEGREGVGRTPSFVALGEEAVDGGPGAADVGAEGAELDEALCERRRREVVRRQRGELAGLDRRQDLSATLVEAGLALEARVDGAGRLLDGAVGQQEDDRVVLRKLQALA